MKRGQNCVYIFRFKGRVIYIGATSNFYSRAGTHLFRQGFIFDSLSFLPTKDRSEANRIEDILIRKYNPKHNGCMRTRRGRKQHRATIDSRYSG